MFDSGVYLDADFLFVFPEALKFDGDHVLARYEAGETVGAFKVRDRFELSVSQSLTAEMHDHSRQRSSLVRNVGNDFPFDTAALCRSSGDDNEGN